MFEEIRDHLQVILGTAEIVERGYKDAGMGMRVIQKRVKLIAELLLEEEKGRRSLSTDYTD